MRMLWLLLLAILLIGFLGINPLKFVHALKGGWESSGLESSKRNFIPLSFEECSEAALNLVPASIYLSADSEGFTGKSLDADWHMTGFSCDMIPGTASSCNEYKNFWNDGTEILNPGHYGFYDAYESHVQFNNRHFGSEERGTEDHYYIELGRRKSRFIDENGDLRGNLEFSAQFTLKMPSQAVIAPPGEIYVYKNFDVVDASIVKCNLEI